MVIRDVPAPGLGATQSRGVRAGCGRREGPRGRDREDRHRGPTLPRRPAPGGPPSHLSEVVDVLADLTARVDSGRVYDRDLPTLVTAVRGLVDALNRRNKDQHPAPVVTPVLEPDTRGIQPRY